MALPTSGNEINFGALPDNRSSASKANISLKQESEFFAIGAVGPTGTSRANLNSEPYAISEFGGANYPNSVFSEVVAKLSTTTVGEYVDGETGARIYWDVDDGTTDNYTAGLKLVSDNSIVISETLDFDGSGATKYVTLGTDGFGRSDTRENLRKFFEIDADHIAAAAISTLMTEGQITKAKAESALKNLKINPDAPDPARN